MAIADFDATNSLLKTLYPKGIAFQTLAHDVIWSALTKRTDFGGRRTREVTLQENSASGASSRIQTALARRPRANPVTFLVPRARLYDTVVVDGEISAANKANKAARIVDVVKDAAAKTADSFKLSTINALWSPSGGSLGTVASGGVSATTVTLANPFDSVRFEREQWIHFAQDDGISASAGLRFDGPAQILSINRRTGVLTFDRDIAAMGVLAGDFLFPEDGYQNLISGIPAWLPSTDPGSSDSFFGVNRSQGNVMARSGIRITVEGGNILDAIIDAGGQAQLYGARKISHIALNSIDFATLQKQLRTANLLDVYSKTSGSKLDPVATRLVIPNGMDGYASVVSSRFIPSRRIYGLDMSTWEFASAGTWGEPSGKWYPSPTEDAMEQRIVGYGNLSCSNPGANYVASLAA